MIGAIWAQTRDRVIGRDGKIPWRYPGDLARFKRLTMGSVVVMGRLTYESIGKALPGRDNIVVTSSRRMPPKDVVYVRSVADAIDYVVSLCLPVTPTIWFIGGARIYEAAMPYVDTIDVTYVPDVVPVEDSVRAPEIDMEKFVEIYRQPHPDDQRLTVTRYGRRVEPQVSWVTDGVGP